ncbi:bifunctional diaminohydroxyphosphoribosylaminopyrimidine deaminase/5-amino-6-(5-phosphoribosylamino)uracil reductase RibD [Alphaproteobacteria bacterium]|nr:bifunctional diaminohydroxyphosphoribosylaminopyrimidine deaminase/5-amino-6-(5-phosphoribosylamino)uracil reductase RibD [Alphaproteobacteria bacterium]
MQANDHYFMQQAIALGRRGLGRTAPNPSVGCVLVASDDRVVGTGWTQATGRPHAETQALAQAGTKASGATAYVSLEPCAHEGETGACAKALVQAGVKHVYFANTDPDARVAGKGAQILKAAGIGVDIGLCEPQARQLHQGFFSRIQHKRPMVTLKLALSANGFMRTPDGSSPWITGPLARNYGHLLRAQHDAILTGAGTLQADNPSLDCRLSGMADRSPLPVVMSRLDVVPEDCKLASRRDANQVLFYTQAKTRDHGFHYVALDALTPSAVLADLAERGMTRVLLECGPGLARAFLRDGLVDALALFKAPHEVAISGDSDISLMGLNLADDFSVRQKLVLGDDIFESWHRQTDQEAA